MSFQGCRYGQVNYGVPFGCFFWEYVTFTIELRASCWVFWIIADSSLCSTPNCDHSAGKQGIWLTNGHADLKVLGWDVSSFFCSVCWWRSGGDENMVADMKSRIEFGPMSAFLRGRGVVADAGLGKFG